MRDSSFLKGIILIIFLIFVINFVDAVVIFQDDFENGLGNWQVNNTGVSHWFYGLISDIGIADQTPPQIGSYDWVNRTCPGSFSNCSSSKNKYVYFLRGLNYESPILYRSFSTKNYTNVRMLFFLDQYISYSNSGHYSNLEEGDSVWLLYRIGHTGEWHVLWNLTWPLVGPWIQWFWPEYENSGILDNQTEIQLGFTFSPNYSPWYSPDPYDHYFLDDFQILGDPIPIICGNDIVELGEQCDGGECCNTDCTFKSSQTVCRAATDVCDLEEKCTGSSATCPTDVVKSSSEVCRASAGECDIAENCDGSNKACPTDIKSTAVCRVTAGDCDVAESCDGLSNDCPTNTFLPISTICRTASDDCDIAESCTGSSASCPTDIIQPENYTCRASEGVCDLAEVCDGSNKACPTDAKSTDVCRPSVDVCDVGESCNGISNTCPIDSFQPSSYVCRAASGECDVADKCTGNSVACPNDVKKLSGTLCGIARDCPADGCYGFFVELYPNEGHDACDGQGNCNVYSCGLEKKYCSDNDAKDGINGFKCGAACDQDTDCMATECDYLDGCYIGKYRDYSDVANQCLAHCSCTQNDCTNYVETAKDSDSDNVDDPCDTCPNTKLDEGVDQNGCSNPQFCKKQAQCGLSCDYADWKKNEPLSLNPHDCITVIVHKGGMPEPMCAGMTCAD